MHKRRREPPDPVDAFSSSDRRLFWRFAHFHNFVSLHVSLLLSASRLKCRRQCKIVYSISVCNSRPSFKHMATSFEVVPILTGSVSAFFSFLVVVTLLKFPQIMKRKLFVHVIFNISLSNLISALAYAWGFPTNQFLCETQGKSRIFY